VYDDGAEAGCSTFGWRGCPQAVETLAAARIPAPPRILENSSLLTFCRVADPELYVFGPLRSGSNSTRYGSGSGSGSFNHQAEIGRKTLIPTVL
jgi:hypothetical protein